MNDTLDIENVERFYDRLESIINSPDNSANKKYKFEKKSDKITSVHLSTKKDRYFFEYNIIRCNNKVIVQTTIDKKKFFRYFLFNGMIVLVLSIIAIAKKELSITETIICMMIILVIKLFIEPFSYLKTFLKNLKNYLKII